VWGLHNELIRSVMVKRGAIWDVWCKVSDHLVGYLHQIIPFFFFTLIISKSLLSDFSQNYYNHYLNKIKTHKRGALPMVFAKITAIRTDCYVFVCFLNIFYLKYIKIIFLNFIFNIILSRCWIWELDNKKPSWTDFIAQPSLSYHILKYENFIF